MADSLNVIALISGGKDSLFSILHCLANGHTIVALANLHPPSTTSRRSSISSTAEDEDEDINSYMYQTVGHSVIPLYAEALELPLYRQEILGSAVNTARDYSYSSTPQQDGQHADETESLVPLLWRVKRLHPEANAVSTGAILSTYQRTRVESVALRLGLVPLSFLWQYPLLPPYLQSGLLSDMAAVGQDSRIIKVASGGLDQGFLWENVADPRVVKRLAKAMARFGENGDGAVLGEGGEYETLAIDGPGVLWKKRIEIEPDGVIVGEGGNAVFRGKNARTTDEDVSVDDDLEKLRIPDMWDDEFKEILDALSADPPPSDNQADPESHEPWNHSAGWPAEWRDSDYALLRTEIHPCQLWNLDHSTPRTRCAFLGCHHADNAAAQLTEILKQLSDLLSAEYRSSSMTDRTVPVHTTLVPGDISHVTILLRRMSDFATLNAVYGSFFSMPNPPSRVTVACGDALPEGVDVMLSAVAITPTDDHRARKGLHVQSRSYWAPANIGPYSQAISVPVPDTDSSTIFETEAEIVYVAGQIPLVPASMTIYEERGFQGQAVLALQHLWRIGRAMNVSWWTAGVAYISSCSPAEASSRVRIAQEVWTRIHEHYLKKGTASGEDGDDDDEGEQDDIDPWDLRNRVFGGSHQRSDDRTSRAPIPDPSVLFSNPDSQSLSSTIPPCIIVQVSALPRAADIEYHSTGLAHTSIQVPSFPHPLLHTTHLPPTHPHFVSLEITPDLRLNSCDCIHALLEKAIPRKFLVEEIQWEHATLYAGPGITQGLGFERWAEAVRDEGWGWIPCERVWGRDGRELCGVLMGRVTVSYDRGRYGEVPWEGYCREVRHTCRSPECAAVTGP